MDILGDTNNRYPPVWQIKSDKIGPDALSCFKKEITGLTALLLPLKTIPGFDK